MKTYISLFLLFLIPMALGAQFRMVSNGTPSWTTVNDSTYSATITFAADQTGNSYVANAIQQNYRVFTGTEQLYRISAVANATFSSADLTIVRTSGSGAPTGQVMVFNPDGRETVPQVPFGSTGSTALLQAAVVSWNARPGFVPPLPLADLAREGAVLNDAIRWNGVEWVAAPVNSFEFVDTVLTLTVCNNLDTCFSSRIEPALQAATRLKAAYDTINKNTRIEIVLRPNPDESPIIWNEHNTLVISGGDYSGIFFSSKWQDSTYTVQVTQGMGALVEALNTSNLSFSDLALKTEIANQLSFRFTDCNSTYVLGSMFDGFRNNLNIFRGSCFLSEVATKNTVNKSVWNQNGYVTISGGSFEGAEIDNRGVMLMRICDMFVNVRNKGFISLNLVVWPNETLPAIKIINEGGFATVSAGTELLPSYTNIPVNTITNLGSIIEPRQPYPFQPSAAEPDPGAIDYYTDTSTGANILKIEQDSQWVDVGLPSILPRQSVAINAQANNLTFENLPLFRVTNLDTAATVTHEFFNSSNSVIPHRWSRYEAGDSTKIEMQYGEMVLKDTSGEHSLADLAKQHYISLTNGFQSQALTASNTKVLLGTVAGRYGSAEQLTDSTLQLGPGQWKIEYTLRAQVDSDSLETYQSAIFVGGSINLPSIYQQRFNDNLAKELRPILAPTGFATITVPAGETRTVTLEQQITGGGTAQLDRANLIATRLTP